MRGLAGEASSPAPGARSGRALNPGGAKKSLEQGVGPSCDFDATVYALKLPADQITRIDVDDLGKAAEKVDAFEKALAKIGKPKPLYRASQSVMLQFDTIRILAQTPYVSNSTRQRGGASGADAGGATTGARGGAPQVFNTITYTNVGAEFRIQGTYELKRINLKLNIQLSVMGDSPTAISDAIKAPLFRNVTLVQNGPVEPNKPFVIMSMDSASTDADDMATAYIARVNLGEPCQFNNDAMTYAKAGN
jgi:hypothetical protein